MTTTILFRSRDLLVRQVGRGAGATCFVTFDSYTDVPALDRPGFGEHHFVARGIDAIHILSRTNRWYQYPELDAALAAAARASAAYRRVIAYDSSMGGFAALTYGAACGAVAGLALCPQFSIDPELVPFERRWPAEARATRFRGDAPRPLQWQAIVLDPRDAGDRAHAALFAARSPTDIVRVQHGGHPVGAYLLEVGGFAPLLDGVAAGRLDVAALERRLRGGRRCSSHYHFVLSRRLGAHHAPAREALARTAVALRPDDPACISHLALLLDGRGARAEARGLHERAVALPSASPHTLYNLVLHHERGSDWPAALALLDRLVAQADAPRGLRRARARIRARAWSATRAGRWLRRLGLAGTLAGVARLCEALRR